MLHDFIIIVACVVASAAFLKFVTRTSDAPSRRRSNDFTGAVVAVIGTTYAVILAFTLSGVWNMFQQAQVNEEQEANALVNLYRIAGQLHTSTGDTIQGWCVRYADNAINREWPAMRSNQTLPGGGEIIDELWRLAGAQANAHPSEIAAYQLMEELRGLTQYRRIRATQAREGLPAILWAVLIIGGIITVASACFFGVPSFRFHLLQVLVLSLLISLVLVAIDDIDQPYQGVLVVAPEGFTVAARTMHNLEKP